MPFLTRFLLTILAAVAVVIALSASAGAQGIPPDTYTRGCYQTGVMSPQDEGFPIMYCPEDGATYYIDLDGQPYANDAGYPVYPAGSWVQLP